MAHFSNQLPLWFESTKEFLNQWFNAVCVCVWHRVLHTMCEVHSIHFSNGFSTSSIGCVCFTIFFKYNKFLLCVLFKAPLYYEFYSLLMHQNYSIYAIVQDYILWSVLDLILDFIHANMRISFTWIFTYSIDRAMLKRQLHRNYVFFLVWSNPVIIRSDNGWSFAGPLAL